MFSFSPDCSVRHCHVSAEKACLRVLIAIASKIHAVPSFVCWYRDVVPHVAYTYQVQTVSGRSDSEPSPPLIHELGAPYCGDGRIQRWDETTMLACAVILRNKGLNLPIDPPSSKGEECDDMNTVNGDGCSSQCKKEPFFNCVGEF